MICAIVYQLTKDLSPEEIERSGFDRYYVDHTLGIYPVSAAGVPWDASTFQSKGDPITDLHEDMAADGAMLYAQPNEKKPDKWMFTDFKQITYASYLYSQPRNKTDQS